MPFPLPHTDLSDLRIDLNEIFNIRKHSCFLFRVRGNAMEGIGILDGDTVVTDRSLPPKDGHIVLVVMDGQFTIRRLKTHPFRLLAEHPKVPPIYPTEGQEVRIWGVVTGCLRKMC